METFSALLAFVRGIHRSPENSPHNGQWRGALMFSLIFAWTNNWRRWWFETPSHSLWRYCNGMKIMGALRLRFLPRVSDCQIYTNGRYFAYTIRNGFFNVKFRFYTNSTNPWSHGFRDNKSTCVIVNAWRQSGIVLLPEQMFTKLYVAMWRHYAIVGSSVCYGK